jgi:signal transduction histidine kinase
VRAAKTTEALHVSVLDTGIGIPEHMLEPVFQRFWQVGENDQRGVGLGLYISKCIVEAHGGRIWAESKLHKGSAFHFTIPAAGSA